jgi:hypothetical protein
MSGAAVARPVGGSAHCDYGFCVTNSLPIAGDVPAWVALATALASVGATALVAGVSAWASRQAAVETARATMKAASEPTIAESMKRAAEWQMSKRALYADFLAAGRKIREGPTGESEVSVFLGLRDRVLLIARDDVRSAVTRLPKNLSGVNDEEWDQLIHTLNEHARDPGS